MTKKSLLTLLLALVFSLPLAAQEEEERIDYSDTTFWDFGLYVSPDYNYRMISGNGSNGVTSDALSNIEIFRIGYTVGGIVTRQLGKRLYIQTGILYQSKGYRTNALQDTVLDLYDQYYSSSEYYNIIRYNTLHVPVLLKIKLFKAGSVQFNLGIGAAPEFYMSKSTLSVFKDHTEKEISKAEQAFDIQGIFNLNVNIPLSNKLSLAIEPCFRYNLLGMKDEINSGIKRNMYTPGVGIQLCYKITDLTFYDYFYLHIYKKPPKSAF